MPALRTRVQLGAVALLFIAVTVVAAAPPLTTIQDVLYKADGTKFNGIAVIEWKSFEAVDQSNIATHQVTVRIVNGILKVQLVPTTNASAGAYYQVRYNSDGKVQFMENWAVPPAGASVKLKDVRIASGGVAESWTIDITDVAGLNMALGARPIKAVGYAPLRTAVINAGGELEAAVGSPNDCIHVDGTSGPCGSGGGSGPVFVDGETPAGVVDGSNATFTLSSIPTPPAGLLIYRNGILQKQGLDYTLSGGAVTFVTGAVPQAGDILLASYRVGGSSQPATFQVICNNDGSSTNGTALVSLGSCTIPAASLLPGDRLELRFHYSHEGAASGFTFSVRWGATTVASRSAAATDSLAIGEVNVVPAAGGAQYGAQSWGSELALAAAAGNAPDSLSAGINIDFLGQMAASTGDSVTLRNFTVIRYPAQ